MHRVTALAVLFLSLSLTGSALLLSNTDAAVSAGKQLPAILESGTGDVIHLQQREFPARNRQTVVQDKSPGFTHQEGIRARLVTICLKNTAYSSDAKAFDIQRSGPPRYIAETGDQVCAKFEPTRHTLYFWKANKQGKLNLTLSNRLDLSDADGALVMLSWMPE